MYGVKKKISIKNTKHFSKHHFFSFSNLILSQIHHDPPIPSLKIPYFNHRFHLVSPNSLGEIEGTGGWGLVHMGFFLSLYPYQFLFVTLCFLLVSFCQTILPTGFAPLLPVSYCISTLCHCTRESHAQAVFPQECPCLFALAGTPLRKDCLLVVAQMR